MSGEFWVQAAKSKRPAGEDAPLRQPMRPSSGIRQAPSADQKKVRRAMSRGVHKNASKEIAMSDTQREADLLRAMAKATPEEGIRLAADLEDLRGARLASIRADREVDLAHTAVTAHLTPVATYERNTSGTDWIDTVAMVEGDQAIPMKTAATRWFAKVSAEVKEDREEFAIQAQGAARREASAYGEQMPACERAFLDHVAHLYRAEQPRGKHAAVRKVADESYNGYTNWDTWNADLWLSNEQTLYNACSRAIDADEIRQIFQGAVDSGVITDDIDADAVNWDEVYETFHEDDHLGSRKIANDAVDPDNGQGQSTVTRYQDLAPVTEEPAFDEGFVDTDDEDTGVHPSLPDGSTGARKAAKTAAAPDLDAMMAWEDGSLDEDGTVALFQSLIDSGLAWSLQGAYGRQAQALIDAGLCTAPGATAARKTAGQTCSTCGAAIERDPEGEANRGYHHNDGSRHDHEAKPTTEASRRVANDAVDPDNGHADSALPVVDVHTNTNPAFPWEIETDKDGDGDGAADVASVPTPGAESGYPQPKGASRKTADLNSDMEFDYVIQVNADGTHTDAPSGLYAPEINLDVDEGGSYVGDADAEAQRQAQAQGWTLLSGYSGQYGFGSADVLMHSSESIGGGLERDILAKPGYYVVTAAEISDGSAPDNWVVAYKPLGTTSSRKTATDAFQAGDQVELLMQGQWEGPFIVVALIGGRTPDHLIMRNPANGVIFEQYNDAPYNMRPIQRTASRKQSEKTAGSNDTKIKLLQQNIEHLRAQMSTATNKDEVRRRLKAMQDRLQDLQSEKTAAFRARVQASLRKQADAGPWFVYSTGDGSGEQQVSGPYDSSAAASAAKPAGDDYFVATAEDPDEIARSNTPSGPDHEWAVFNNVD